MSLSTTSPREPSRFKFNYNTSAPLNLKQSNVQQILKQINIAFTKITKISDTLQGSVYRAIQANNKSVVIKVTNRYLHNHSSAMVQDKLYNCNENIIVESNILKYLTQNNCPNSIVKFHSFSETNTDYLFIMEDGGNSLFEFIQRVHKLIKAGKIEISHWRCVCKIIFKQMIQCLDYIHSHNIVHYDISLENFLINDVNIKIKQTDTKKESLQFVVRDIQIKLCDFGLARIFQSKNTQSNNFVGKTRYKSPEICNKQPFDGKKNDIWGLGICLFCMFMGITPFHKAIESDDAFKFIMKYHKMRELLNAWNVLHYLDNDMYDLMDKLLQYEAYRIDLEGIKKHCWIK